MIGTAVEAAQEMTSMANKPPPKPQQPTQMPHPDPWSTVQVVSEMAGSNALKVLLTSPNGGGKSTCAAKFERPLIGLTELQAQPAILHANPRAIIKVIKTPQQLQEFRQLIVSKDLASRCDAVVLDSLTDIQRLIKWTIMQGQEARQDILNLDSWGIVKDKTIRIAREIRDVPVHAVVICLDSETDSNNTVIHRPSLEGKGLGNSIGQFFNVVGYVRKTAYGDTIRREVLFDGPDTFQLKTLPGLDSMEPPEPLLWLNKLYGTTVPDAPDAKGRTVAQRHAEWLAMASEPSGDTSASSNADGTAEPALS